MPRNTFISIAFKTRQKFNRVKKDYNDDPNISDNNFLDEILDFVIKECE